MHNLIEEVGVGHLILCKLFFVLLLKMLNVMCQTYGSEVAQCVNVLHVQPEIIGCEQQLGHRSILSGCLQEFLDTADSLLTALIKRTRENGTKTDRYYCKPLSITSMKMMLYQASLIGHKHENQINKL